MLPLARPCRPENLMKDRLRAGLVLVVKKMQPVLHFCINCIVYTAKVPHITPPLTPETFGFPDEQGVHNAQNKRDSGEKK